MYESSFCDLQIPSPSTMMNTALGTIHFIFVYSETSLMWTPSVLFTEVTVLQRVTRGFSEILIVTNDRVHINRSLRDNVNCL